MRQSRGYTLADVLLLLAAPAQTLVELRDRAAIAFLFLTGMRVDAFVTMPIEAVHIEGKKPWVEQDPDLGMRTKNRQSGITFFYTIPELLAIVRDWDRRVRNELPLDVLWYAHVDSEGSAFTGATEAGQWRRLFVAKALRRMCKRAGVKYRPPHSLRHGNAFYGLELAQDSADRKAVSLNLMHKNLRIVRDSARKMRPLRGSWQKRALGL